jgi:hypothetical protein
MFRLSADPTSALARQVGRHDDAGGFLVPTDRASLQDARMFVVRSVGDSGTQWKYQLSPAIRHANGLPNVVYQFAPTRITRQEIVSWYGKEIRSYRAFVRGKAALLIGKLLRRMTRGAHALTVRSSAER